MDFLRYIGAHHGKVRGGRYLSVDGGLGDLVQHKLFAGALAESG